MTTPAAGGPQANPDSGFTVNENGSITIATSTLLANDTDTANLALSFTGVSGAVNGTVSYNAAAGTVTFTPTANYAGAASFSYSIADTSGATATGQVSLNVTYPKSAQSLFGTNDTPSEINSNDSSAVELGVKFTASTNGTITGIRFYKGPTNTGTACRRPLDVRPARCSRQRPSPTRRRAVGRRSISPPGGDHRGDDLCRLLSYQRRSIPTARAIFAAPSPTAI